MSARFFQRPYPSANTILLDGARPILVDTGAGSDVPALLAWLEEQRTWPSLVVNTHWHSDHAGGNHALQARGLAVAAPAAEADAVNARHPGACRAVFLDQQVESYWIDHALTPGMPLETGTATWRVIALPGHTAAQIGLFNEPEGILISSDALHATDIGWLDLDADPAALEQTEATIDQIAALPIRLLLPGHGPAVTDVSLAIQNARRRLASWRAKPERIGWHACKRIFSHMLMLEGGLAMDQVAIRLTPLPWFQAHARRAFGVEPPAFVPMLVDEMLRSGAATLAAGSLIATATYTPADPAWPQSPATPSLWPVQCPSRQDASPSDL